MYCANCGFKLDNEARFCPECGAAVETSETTPSPESVCAPPQPAGHAPNPAVDLRFLKDLTRRKGFKPVLVVTVLLLAYLCYMFSQRSPFAATWQQPINQQANRTGVPATQNQTPNPEIKLDLEPYNNGFFSINKPRGWQVNTGGSGSTFCYTVQDPNEPLREIVYFGEIGPAYLSERQKQIDQAAVNMGATVSWLDSPVVAPLNPQNYLPKIPQILNGNFMRAVHVLPGPDWGNFQILEVTPRQTAFEAPDAQCALIRALFTLNNQVGEGLFLVTVSTLMPENGNPFVGTGYSVCFTAITAPQREFRFVEQSLTRAAGSAALSREYLTAALQKANSNWGKIFAAGKVLRETSDIITSGWEQRNKTYDLIAEKRADAIRGVERVYDPDTNKVYTVSNGWFEQYNQDRGRYHMNNLQSVPGDSALYLNPTLDGNRNIQ